MSNISTAYDDILSVIEGILPNHQQLINPYLPDLNDDLTFEKAWGFAFAEGVNTNLQLACRLSIDRTFRFTLTRKIFAGQLQRGVDAVTVRRNAEKQLFEDHYLVIKELEQNPTITDSQVITKLVYQGDAGLEFVRTEMTNLIILNSTFVLTYFEEI